MCCNVLLLFFFWVVSGSNVMQLCVLRLKIGLQLNDVFATTFANVVLTSETALLEVSLDRNSVSGKGIKAIAEVLGRTGVSIYY